MGTEFGGKTFVLSITCKVFDRKQSCIDFQVSNLEWGTALRFSFEASINALEKGLCFV